MRRLPRPSESGCRIFDGPQLKEKCLKDAVFGRLALIHIWIKSWVGFGDHKCITEELGRAFLSLCLHWKNEFRGKLYFSPILNHISQQWWVADVQPRFVLHLFVLKIMISTQISSGMVSGCWPKSRRPTLETENPWFCSCEMQSENITNRERWFVGDFYDCLLWFDLVHFGIYWYSQVKYRRGSVWRVLQAEGVFGEKIAVDSKWNILINNKGFFYFHHPQQQRYTFRQERFKCRGRPCRWAPQSLLQGLHFFFFIGTKYW